MAPKPYMGSMLPLRNPLLTHLFSLQDTRQDSHIQPIKEYMKKNNTHFDNVYIVTSKSSDVFKAEFSMKLSFYQSYRGLYFLYQKCCISSILNMIIILYKHQKVYSFNITVSNYIL